MHKNPIFYSVASTTERMSASSLNFFLSLNLHVDFIKHYSALIFPLQEILNNIDNVNLELLEEFL